jgi:hypothetical protein
VPSASAAKAIVPSASRKPVSSPPRTISSRPWAHGEDRAGQEDDHRREERPEEALLPVPERMLLVGLALAEADRDEEQPLIHRVRHRVGRLGEQGRRAGDRARDTLRDRDRRICAYRDEHRLLALPGHGGRLAANP